MSPLFDVETNDRVCSLITKKPYTGKYLWLNITMCAVVHLLGIWSVYMLLTQASLCTWISCIFLHHCSILGITIGAHRLWCHRSFKANFPLRVLLMLMNSAAYQLDIIRFCQWHRGHHKWTDTDADPHNINRGLFFGHIGWLLVRPHPEYMSKRDQIDLGDLRADPILRFQSKYYVMIGLMCAFVLPATLAVLLWGEQPGTSLAAHIARMFFSAHIVLSLNTLGHTCGQKPYDSKTTAAGNRLTEFISLGDGYHNFHHTFPMDYRTSESGVWFNPSATIIDFFARIGWATDLKTTPIDVVQKRKDKVSMDGTSAAQSFTEPQ